MFKRRRFPLEIILLCFGWYCIYGISYRGLVEMMQGGEVEVKRFSIRR
jgi:IS6 family transposase